MIRHFDPASAALALLGAAPLRLQPYPGGDLGGAWRAEFAALPAAAIKTGPDPRAEAAMLRALARAGAPAPRVLAVSDTALAMEAVPAAGRLGPAGWAALGAALACMHRDQGAAWGWETEYAFGPVPIPARMPGEARAGGAPSAAPRSDAETPGHAGTGADGARGGRRRAQGGWPAFCAGARLAPCAAHLPGPLAARLDRVIDGIEEILPAAPPAGLLHGDLWTGNILAVEGRLAGLIDPACCHGDGEVDLAMLHLFDRPHPAFHEAYGPLPPEWARRRAVYQLWPALVHVRLFGAGYLGLTAGLLEQAGV